MKIHTSRRSALIWLPAVCLCLAFSSLSCVFLYVGGPEDDNVALVSKREYVESAIVGTWRWIPEERVAVQTDLYCIIHANGEIIYSTEPYEDSLSQISTWELSLERSHCSPNTLVYQLLLGGGAWIPNEVSKLTEDELHLVNCEGSPPMVMKFQRVHFDEDDEPLPPE